METNQENMDMVREALENKRCLKVEFYKDGSGASFYIIAPHGDHGLPCDILMSFPIAEAMQIISGFRFRQHDLPTCF